MIYKPVFFSPRVHCPDNPSGPRFSCTLLSGGLAPEQIIAKSLYRNCSGLKAVALLRLAPTVDGGGRVMEVKLKFCDWLLEKA